MGRRRKPKAKTYELEIESLSHEGRGIAHFEEKVIFVSGALPGETVIADRTFSRAKFEEADVKEVLKRRIIASHQNVKYLVFVVAARFSICRAKIKSSLKVNG